MQGECIDNYASLNIKPSIYFRNSLPEIFPVEIPTSIAQEFLTHCLSHANNEDYIVEILIALLRCKRFKLTLTFMSVQDKAVCKQLFVELTNKMKDKPEKLAATIDLAKEYLVCLDVEGHGN